MESSICLRVCLGWRPQLVRNTFSALIPDGPCFHLLKAVLCICVAVHGLHVRDLFLRVACNVFQDHLSMHRSALIFTLLVYLPTFATIDDGFCCCNMLNLSVQHF